jgi:Fic family protein
MQNTSFHIRPNRDKALMLARRQLAELVCDAVNLEGIPFTLPEIQTLLDGVTVGGHKIADQQVAINQTKAWKYLFGLIEQQLFKVTMETACALHAIAGKDEALEWGKFRSGGVTIAGTSWLPPPAASLPELFKGMVTELAGFQDIYDRAIFLFLVMARTQFFYDVNKRTGRFMMSGLLLSHGFPLINLPAARQLEFNELMLEFYNANDPQPMNTFLRSCLDPRIIAIMNE